MTIPSMIPSLVTIPLSSPVTIPPPSTLLNRNNKRRNIRASDPVYEVNQVFDDLCGGDAELRKLIDDFCVIRAEEHKPITTRRMANIQVGKLMRYSGGDHAIMTAMLEKAIDGRWLSVYELKPWERPQASSAPAVAEWRPGDED